MANKQTIVFDIQAEISQVKKSAQEMRNIFEKMDLSDPLRKSFSGTFTKLERELRNIEVIANKGLSSLSDTKKAETSVEKINDLFEDLKIQMKDMQKFKIDKIVSSDTVKKLKNYKNALEQAINLQKRDNSQKIKKAKEAEAAAIEKVTEAQKKLDDNKTKKSDLESEQKRLTDQIEEQTKAIEELAERRQKLAKISQNKRTGEQQAEYTTVKTDYETAEKALSRYKNELKKVEEEIIKNVLAHTNLSTALQEAQEKQESARQKLEEAKNAAVVTEKELNDLKETIHSLGGGKVDELPNDLKELEKILLDLDLPKQILKEINESMEKMAASGEAANDSLGQMGDKANRGREMAEGFKAANTQVEQLKSRLTYFFSAMNGFQLFKRAIRDAYNSIKELDAAMTEMAVVTDYSISDIWGNIKQYTAEANELGATTKDVINSMVLYTQQGLEMSEATQLSTETMKMARIAGLEGAEATDLRKHWVFI